MMQRNTPNGAWQPSPINDPAIILPVIACVVALPGFLASLGIRQMIHFLGREKPKQYQRGMWLLVGVSAIGGSFLYYVVGRPQELFLAASSAIARQRWEDVVFAVGVLWLFSLLLAPLLSVLLAALVPQKSTEEALLRAETAGLLQTRMSSQSIAKRLQKGVPEIMNGDIVVGIALGGDLGWTHQGWAIFPFGEVCKPGIIIGESRSGKTQTALRLAYLLARHYNWQIIFLDAKGDEELVPTFVAAMLDAGIDSKKIRAFPMLAYDGWVGDERSIYNRLIGLLKTSPYASAGAEYYRDNLKLVLDLAMKAHSSPPRNSKELLSRMRHSYLKAAYAGRPESEEIKEDLSPAVVAGAKNRYRAFFSSVGAGLDGFWSFEDAQASYILLEGASLREEAMSLGRFFIEEIANYCTRRKPRERQVLVVIDDAAALEIGREVTGLIERLAGYGAFTFLTAQTFEGLGPYNAALVGAAATKILHRSSDPETVTERAGTKKEVQRSWQVQASPTGLETWHVRDAPNVHPDVVKRLGTGECVFVANGRGQKIVVDPLHLSEERLDEARSLLARMKAEDWTRPPTPPAMPTVPTVSSILPLLPLKESNIEEEETPHEGASQLPDYWQ